MRRGSSTPCSSEGCSRPVVARGLCRKHYSAAHHRGDFVGVPVAPRQLKNTVCTINGCEKPAKARTWCSAHWLRWKTYGDPTKLAPETMQTPQERFWSRVNGGDYTDCWEWQGALSTAGYGAHHGRGAHRYAYEHMVGEIPPGLHLDHLCFNRACVNPWHLDSVTPEVNTHRMMLHNASGNVKTHCPQGHEYTPENTQRKTGNRRSCRACAREYARRKAEDMKSGRSEAA